MAINLRIELIYQQPPAAGRWGLLLHDFQLTGDYWGENTTGKNRCFPHKNQGKPETVRTYEKDATTVLSPAWQEFYKTLFCLAAFGVSTLDYFLMLRNAFNSTMAYNRVITNHSDWIQGYMTLGMGGNLVKIIGEGRPDAKFGDSYIVETLAASSPPPMAEDVFFNMPWLWHKATICRYNAELDNPWSHVIKFPQLEPWNADTPLMLISRHGKANIQKTRVQEIDHFTIPHPYHP